MFICAVLLRQIRGDIVITESTEGETGTKGKSFREHVVLLLCRLSLYARIDDLVAIMTKIETSEQISQLVGIGIVLIYNVPQRD